MLSKLIKLTDGRKSYLGLLLYGILSMATTEGWLSPEQGDFWMTAAGTLAGIGLTHKFAKFASNK
jgi:hypothetical protein